MNKLIQEEVEKTLRAFDEINKLKENPFLYSRIKALIEAEELTEKSGREFSLKPVIIGAILLINILTGIFFQQANKDYNSSGETAIESLKNDYKINQTYYEFISTD